MAESTETVSILAILRDQFTNPSKDIRSSITGLLVSVHTLALAFETLNSAQEIEENSRRLRASLLEDGKAFDQTIAKVDELTKTTTFSHAEIIKLTSDLLTKGIPIDQLDKARGIAINISTQLGQSLQESSNQLAAAYRGFIDTDSALARIEPRLRGVKAGIISSSEGLDLLANNPVLKGAAEKFAESSFGQIKQAEIRAKESLQAVARVVSTIQADVLLAIADIAQKVADVATSPEAQEAIGFIRHWVKPIAEVVLGFTAASLTIRGVVIAFSLLSPLITIATALFGSLLTVMGLLFSPAGLIVAGIALIATLVAQAAGVEISFDGLITSVKDIFQQFKSGQLTVTDVFAAIQEYILTGAAYVKGFGRDVFQVIESIGAQLARLWADVSPLLVSVFEWIGGIVVKAGSFMGTLLGFILPVDKIKAAFSSFFSLVTFGARNIGLVWTEVIVLLEGSYTRIKAFTLRGIEYFSYFAGQVGQFFKTAFLSVQYVSVEIVAFLARQLDSMINLSVKGLNLLIEKAADALSHINQSAADSLRGFKVEFQTSIAGDAAGAVLADVARRVGELDAAGKKATETHKAILAEIDQQEAEQLAKDEARARDRKKASDKQTADEIAAAKVQAEKQATEGAQRRAGTDPESLRKKQEDQLRNELQLKQTYAERADIIALKSSDLADLERKRETAELEAEYKRREISAAQYSDRLAALQEIPLRRILNQANNNLARAQGVADKDAGPLAQRELNRALEEQLAAQLKLNESQAKSAEIKRELIEKETEERDLFANEVAVRRLRADDNPIAAVQADLLEKQFKFKEEIDKFNKQGIRDNRILLVQEAQRLELAQTLRDDLLEGLGKAHDQLVDTRTENEELFRIGQISLADANRRNADASIKFEESIRSAQRALAELSAKGLLSDSDIERVKLQLSRLVNDVSATAANIAQKINDGVFSGKGIREIQRQLRELVGEVDEVKLGLISAFVEFRDSAQQPLASFIEDVLTGAKTIKEAFADMLQSIAQNMIQTLAGELSKEILNFVTKMTVQFILGEQSRTVAAQAGAAARQTTYIGEAAVSQGAEAAKTAAAVTAETTKTTATQTGSAQRFPTIAAEAGAEAGKSQAGIPYIGPILAVAAIAAMIGIIMALKRNSGGLIDGGGLVPGGGPDEDSVLTHLTTGEFVHRRRATEYYGIGTMDAINRMAVPREVLAAYGGRGSVSGGPIVALNAGGLVEAGERSSGVPSMIEAIIPPTEENFDRLLRGGLPSLFRVLSEHRDKAKSSLGIK